MSVTFPMPSDTPVNTSDIRGMTPTLPPVGKPMVQVSDRVERPTLLVSDGVGYPSLAG